MESENKLSEFILTDKNMKQAMQILESEKHWILANCKQVAMYLDSKGFDGLRFVKVCGEKYGFMDKHLLKMSAMAAEIGGSNLDEYEIELDKVINGVHEYV